MCLRADAAAGAVAVAAAAVSLEGEGGSRGAGQRRRVQSEGRAVAVGKAVATPGRWVGAGSAPGNPSGAPARTAGEHRIRAAAIDKRAKANALAIDKLARTNARAIDKRLRINGRATSAWSEQLVPVAFEQRDEPRFGGIHKACGLMSGVTLYINESLLAALGRSRRFTLEIE